VVQVGSACLKDSQELVRSVKNNYHIVNLMIRVHRWCRIC